MCLICIDFDRGALPLRDARRALGEMSEKLGTAHAREVEAKLEAAERAARDSDPPPSVP